MADAGGLGERGDVSIPNGTIKRYNLGKKIDVIVVFQFQMVRLKDRLRIYRSVFRVGFQFQMVRLKGPQRLCMFRLCLFQFQMVRLKVREIMSH